MKSEMSQTLLLCAAQLTQAWTSSRCGKRGPTHNQMLDTFESFLEQLKAIEASNQISTSSNEVH
jgi:hypothetical protein